MADLEKTTIDNIIAKKNKGEKITMLTAYDYAIGTLVDSAGVDIVLVGDSLANVVLGLDSTKEVSLEEMLHHTRAVRRGVTRALLVGDMPFAAYQVDPDKALANARRFMEEAGCDAVKVEWFDRCPQVVEQLIKAGIPVMGHIGLTPQTADQLGGFKVQGRDLSSAEKIINQAHILEEKGCFSIVLECIPAGVAGIIREDLAIPAIGIGAGPDCDGQVLVINDMLGLFERYKPKFVKRYADLSPLIRQSITTFCREVQEGVFPDEEHSYGMRQKQPAGASGRKAPNRIGKRVARALARHMLVSSRWIIRKMPYAVFQVFIYVFMGLGYSLMLKKRRLAIRNLHKVYGGKKTDEEIENIAKACFRDFGRGMAEVIYYADRPKAIPSVVDIEGSQHLDAALEAGNGAVLVSAHFGNFLLMYFRMVAAGYKTNVIMRRTRDQQFEKYISDFRSAFGLKTIYDLPPRRCIQESLRALRRNEILFILLDQNYGTDGRVFVDFLGHKAATAAGPVVFSCRTQAPILPVFMKRESKHRHKITIEPPIAIERCASEEDTLIRNVAAVTRVIEEYIHRYPHMWGGWMHNRWKSKPVKEQTLVDRLKEKEEKLREKGYEGTTSPRACGVGS